MCLDIPLRHASMKLVQESLKNRCKNQMKSKFYFGEVYTTRECRPIKHTIVEIKLVPCLFFFSKPYIFVAQSSSLRRLQRHPKWPNQNGAQAPFRHIAHCTSFLWPLLYFGVKATSISIKKKATSMRHQLLVHTLYSTNYTSSRQLILYWILSRPHHHRLIHLLIGHRKKERKRRAGAAWPWPT